MSATIHKFPITPRPILEAQAVEPPHNISERQSRKMSLWLIDCERYLGLATTRAMLMIAIKWVDGRMIFGNGRKDSK